MPKSTPFSALTPEGREERKREEGGRGRRRGTAILPASEVHSGRITEKRGREGKREDSTFLNLGKGEEAWGGGELGGVTGRRPALQVQKERERRKERLKKKEDEENGADCS